MSVSPSIYRRALERRRIVRTVREPRVRPAVQIQEQTNVECVVRFLLDGQEFERRVTRRVDDPARDINAESPVGRALLTANVGDEMKVEAPGGCVVVKVLDIR